MSSIAPPALEGVLQSAGPKVYGSVVATDGLSMRIAGLDGFVRLGDTISVSTADQKDVRAKIVALDHEIASAFSYHSLKGVASGAHAHIERAGDSIFPSEDWLGRTISPFGDAMDGKPLRFGNKAYALEQRAPIATERKTLGPRLATGFCVFDTLLPLCQGQRLGIFSGAGVGKSMLVGALSQTVEVDVTVVALIGERGREVRTFVEETLGPEGMKKAVVVASTADQSPLAKKQGAFVALAVAEYFRAQNKQVLLVFDSLTRFAEAHREVAIAAGEPPSLHAFPPSTFRTIASLVERAGPGVETEGDITAIFSVLAQGSDMDEPVSDMIRGILDGHVILERKIAERGRFPAIDVSRSVSRSLPMAASDEENAMLSQARHLLRTYEDAETIVRAGLYAAGSDPQVDRALERWPSLDEFIAERQENSIEASFARLNQILTAKNSVEKAPPVEMGLNPN